MGTKKERREAAQKRARKKRIFLMVACVVCLIAAITFFIIYAVTRPDTRVFAVPSGQSITLYEDGRFSARLFHNVEINGTFTEDTSVGAVSFTHGGNTVFTHIENDVLLLPTEWWGTCMGHTHETRFPLVR
jgi:hypothetical protein